MENDGPDPLATDYKTLADRGRVLNDQAANETRRASAAYHYKSMSWVTLFSAFAMLLGVAGFWIWAVILFFKKDDEFWVPILLSFFLLPAAGAMRLEELGKTMEVRAFDFWLCWASLWYVRIVGWIFALGLGYWAVNEGYKAIDLKAVGIIIIVLLLAVIYNQSRRRE